MALCPPNAGHRHTALSVCFFENLTAIPLNAGWWKLFMYNELSHGHRRFIKSHIRVRAFNEPHELRRVYGGYVIMSIILHACEIAQSLDDNAILPTTERQEIPFFRAERPDSIDGRFNLIRFASKQVDFNQRHFISSPRSAGISEGSRQSHPGSRRCKPACPAASCAQGCAAKKRCRRSSCNTSNRKFCGGCDSRCGL